MWPDAEVAELVAEELIPVRVHVQDHAEEYRRLGARYGVEWTPTILILDPSGEERHRIEGFVPAGELRAQLELGLGRFDFSAGAYGEAERRFRGIVEREPDAEVAPEALYWAGVAKYKATDDGSALEETALAFHDRYQSSPWATKASVWEPE